MPRTSLTLPSHLQSLFCRLLRFRGVVHDKHMRPTVILLMLLVACTRSGNGGKTDEGPLVVFNAGSLARPIRAALDSFAAREGVRFEQEQAGSLETARKLTELGRVPDVIALADYEVFPQLLVPEHTTWYAKFARNRMVLAHTPQSRHVDSITPANWWRIVLRPGVETGELDYAFEYESVARGASLGFVAFPDSISLGNMTDSAFYETAMVRVVGRRPG